jgi:beta-glucuronidase
LPLRGVEESLNVVIRALALSLLLALAAAAGAQAQAPVSPPTHSVVAADGQTDRYLLGGTWLYRADRADVGVSQGWWQPTSSTAGWSPVSVPNAYNAGDLSTQSWLGYVGWYRRDFTLPSGAFPGYVPTAFQHWILRFESVNYYATVWLNGRQIATHGGAFLPWEVNLNGLHGGVNTLVIRVDDRTTSNSLPPGPGSNWWNFGGILREVYLRAVAKVDLQQVQIRPLLKCPGCAATISEQARLHNVTNVPQTVRLHGLYGRVPIAFGQVTVRPHATSTVRASARLPHPRLWAPGSPALYKATLTLTDAHGRPLGGYLDYSGVRSVTVKNGRLFLNGRLLHLRGVDMQEQNVSSGGALSPEQTQALIGWARQLDATIIRAHYPVGPLMEELADRDGILIWSEVPAFGIPDAILRQPSTQAQARQLLAKNVLENQNHPSILLWSIGNELPTPPTGAEGRYIKAATKLVHRLDPTRPVGIAIPTWGGEPCSAAYRPLDVIGGNEYFGLFDEGGGSTDDRSQLGPFLDSFRACYPNKALFVTEFGFDGNRNGPVEEYGSYQFQANMLAYHLGVFASKPWLAGALVQILQDFASYPGYNGANPYPNTSINGKGLVDQRGGLKPAFSVVSQIFHSTTQVGPRVYGGSRAGTGVQR